MEATSQPDEQSASEEKPAAGETKPDSAGGEASEQATAAASAEQEKEGTTEEEPDDEEPNDGVPIVLVTGASGFIATHLIKQLLEQGRYRIRGTVRSKKRQEKV